MIIVENVSKSIDGKVILNNLNFEVAENSVTALLGPNGAGKTTTMRLLSTYTLPSIGKVTVQGLSTETHSAEIRNILGYLPENNPLYSEMSVFDYLEFIANCRNIETRNLKKAVDSALSKCSVNSKKHSLISTLSKGYRQRVGLAAALIHDPKVIIMDEPTTGLDPSQVLEIRELISELGREKTVLLSTHILSEVELVCRNAVIISNGEIKASSSLDALSTLINKNTIKATLKRENKTLLSDIENLNHISSLESNKIENHGWEIKIQTTGEPERMLEKVYELIKKSDSVLLAYSLERNSLEDIFLDITNENKATGEVNE